jgi:hypothetical protein
MDYGAEIKRIEEEVAKREAKRNQLTGLLEAKKSELSTIEATIREKFGCEPCDLVGKAEGIKTELEKNILDMKTVLGLG